MIRPMAHPRITADPAGRGYRMVATDGEIGHATLDAAGYSLRQS